MPSAFLDLLKLDVGASVEIGVQNSRLTVQPKVCPTCTLEQLLAQCSQFDTRIDEDRAWTDAKPVGEDLL